VFFEDAQHTRLTSTFEKVGTSSWMAPWARTGNRVDDIRPTFDIFPLGKLLWTMVSGEPELPPYYTHKDAEFGLEKYIPGRTGTGEVDAILDKCIVKEEGKCLPNASALLEMVDGAIDALEHAAVAERVVLASPAGDFKVQIMVLEMGNLFQLFATPLKRDSSGKWIADVQAQVPSLAKWRLELNGHITRIGAIA